MGFSETIFLFFLALLIFGPKKLPEVARQLGKMMNEFKKASNDFRSQITAEIAQLETSEGHQQILPPTAPPTGAVNHAPVTLDAVPNSSSTTQEPAESHPPLKVAPDA
ncbi:MAG TPA: twin-arginine translocase TatA/TatE family subunit [Terriglobales bacterium]|nr:twin-arginine translocase TatA/TatE family subunit [Terriglobales bacterium]